MGFLLLQCPHGHSTDKAEAPGRRGLSLSLGNRTMDEAVKQMFSLTPAQSRRIIAKTSTSQKSRRK